MRQIPDLRDTPEITLEHCSVLLEKIGKAIDIMEGETGTDVTALLNPELLKDHYEKFFDLEAFDRLFKTELGKGVLIGSYVQKALEKMKGEEI